MDGNCRGRRCRIIGDGSVKKWNGGFFEPKVEGRRGSWGDWEESACPSPRSALLQFCEINVMADISIWEELACLVFPHQSKQSGEEAPCRSTSISSPLLLKQAEQPRDAHDEKLQRGIKRSRPEVHHTSVPQETPAVPPERRQVPNPMQLRGAHRHASEKRSDE